MQMQQQAMLCSAVKRFLLHGYVNSAIITDYKNSKKKLQFFKLINLFNVISLDEVSYIIFNACIM